MSSELDKYHKLGFWLKKRKFIDEDDNRIFMNELRDVYSTKLTRENGILNKLSCRMGNHEIAETYYWDGKELRTVKYCVYCGKNHYGVL